MQFKQLVSLFPEANFHFVNDVSIIGITDDSRKVQPGYLFIAIKGEQVDGHHFISKAVENGAVAIVAEEFDSTLEISQCILTNTKQIALTLALEFYGNPQKQLKFVGVTGTNGKTTVSTIVYQVLTHVGYTCGLIGTVQKRIGSTVVDSKLTTPGALELASDLHEMQQAGCSHCIMEVSSHALKQNRVGGLAFDVAIFTNLTRDHLDYHKTIEDYAQSKQLLFNRLSSESVAIVNADDSYGLFMVQATEATVWEASLRMGSGAILLQNNANGIVIDLDGIRIESKLSGMFNAYNVLEAYLACCALGLNRYAIVEALAHSSGAEGRLQKVQIANQAELPTVFVDYAHTPDALENVLKTVRDLKSDQSKLFVVFGCGGNRDNGKRPQMAAIAEHYGDFVMITSDNPRFESEEEILNEIEAGFSNKARFERITDRVSAINRAVELSNQNDFIVIAGKGHETYQEIKGVRYPMDDRKIAEEALALKTRVQNQEVS